MSYGVTYFTQSLFTCGGFANLSGQTSIAHRAGTHCHGVYMGTWNVRLMVDTEGPVEVANQRADGQRGEDRRLT